MQKFLLFVLVFFIGSSIFISCKKKVQSIQTTRMNITHITLDKSNYTIAGLRGKDETGEHELILRNAIYENGCPLPGDSAIVYYIVDKNDSLIALRIKTL